MKLRRAKRMYGYLRRSRLVVSWIRSGGEPNGYDLCTPIAELNPPLPGWGEYCKRAHVRKLFQSLDGWEVRGVRWKVWRADPNYRFRGSNGAAANCVSKNSMLRASSGHASGWKNWLMAAVFRKSDNSLNTAQLTSVCQAKSSRPTEWSRGAPRLMAAWCI
jgi:hypothetical protein